MTTMVRVLDARDHVRSRWRNDGGWTTEVARSAAPDGDGFRWRVSIAEIETDGPFSAFPGIERDLLLLAGAGIELTIDDEPPVRISERLGSVHFRGEAAVGCRLLAGPTRDLNVMTRRDLVRATVSVHRLTAGSGLDISAGPAEELVAHVCAGSVVAHLDGRETLVPVGSTVHVEGRPGSARATPTGGGLSLRGTADVVIARLATAGRDGAGPVAGAPSPA